MMATSAAFVKKAALDDDGAAAVLARAWLSSIKEERLARALALALDLKFGQCQPRSEFQRAPTILRSCPLPSCFSLFWGGSLQVVLLSVEGYVTLRPSKQQQQQEQEQQQ
eukprot:CAMPEP_0206581086 /NCGR_PEP_ID=MMETSP0325_2-20121206/33600_1 /ASSEMBLY_ACC=CAM_ASM_000347 /TAXON_ID=2866 /ORGANISM="Crypthecodinium cohnii, Strain Seligo" /LENGTH=109 /DNA_ID=CAMNT_0054087351 /DNA_START=132 /DNA_END=457 /DNA_ORIENTATION=-